MPRGTLGIALLSIQIGAGPGGLTITKRFKAFAAQGRGKSRVELDPPGSPETWGINRERWSLAGNRWAFGARPGWNGARLGGRRGVWRAVFGGSAAVAGVWYVLSCGQEPHLGGPRVGVL